MYVLKLRYAWWRFEGMTLGCDTLSDALSLSFTPGGLPLVSWSSGAPSSCGPGVAD